MNLMTVAVLQMKVEKEKERNLEKLERLLENKKIAAADLVILPEMFTCPYKTSLFPDYAEVEGGPSWKRCAALAARHHIYLAAGSMPERGEDGRIYNTSCVFDRNGRQIARHRKVHLFDINVEGQYFRESDTLSAGSQVTVFDTEFCKIGLCICYDIRFPELFRLMTAQGANVILVPASFNMTTGPAHWELLFRGRAVDNQVYMIGASSARDENADYVSWGHSIITDPWGNIVMQMDEKEGFSLTRIDLNRVKKVREELPLLKNRRSDLYDTKNYTQQV